MFITSYDARFAFSVPSLLSSLTLTFLGLYYSLPFLFFSFSLIFFTSSSIFIPLNIYLGIIILRLYPFSFIALCSFLPLDLLISLFPSSFLSHLVYSLPLPSFISCFIIFLYILFLYYPLFLSSSS